MEKNKNKTLMFTCFILLFTIITYFLIALSALRLNPNLNIHDMKSTDYIYFINPYIIFAVLFIIIYLIFFIRRLDNKKESPSIKRKAYEKQNHRGSYGYYWNDTY